MTKCEYHAEIDATWTARDEDGKVHQLCSWCFMEWENKRYPPLKAKRKKV